MKLLIIHDEDIDANYLSILKDYKLFFDEIDYLQIPQFEFVYKGEIVDHQKKMKNERNIHYPRSQRNHIQLEEYADGYGVNQNEARQIAINAIKMNNKLGVYYVYITSYPLLQDMHEFKDVPSDYYLKQKEYITKIDQSIDNTQNEIKEFEIKINDLEKDDPNKLELNNQILMRENLITGFIKRKQIYEDRIKNVSETIKLKHKINLQTFGLFANRSVLLSIHDLTPEQFVKVYNHEWFHTFIVGHCEKVSLRENYNCLMSRMGHPTDIDLASGLCAEHMALIQDNGFDVSNLP